MDEKLPDAIIPGMDKCGTRTMLGYLHDHPDIFVPWNHNTDMNLIINGYFSRLMNGKEDQIDFSNYSNDRLFVMKDAEFRSKDNLKIIEYLEEYKPDVKLIFLMRDPVKRAYSQYWHKVIKEGLQMEFEKAIEKLRFIILQQGAYKKIIKKFDLFPEENKYYIISEKLWKNKDSCLRKIFNFLGVKKNYQVNKKIHKNKGGAPRSYLINNFVNNNYKIPIISTYFSFIFPIIRKGSWFFNLKKYPDMKKETRHKLIQYYKKENKGLDKIIGKDLSRWWNWWE